MPSNYGTTSINSLQFYWQNFPEIKYLLGTILVTALYYSICFIFFDRRPKMPTIIPLFQAPQKLSAAACRYLLNMRYDYKVFNSALVQLAAQGYIKMTKGRQIYDSFLELVPNKATDELPECEQELLKNMFSDSTRVNCIGNLYDVNRFFADKILDTFDKDSSPYQLLIPLMGNFISYLLFALTIIMCLPDTALQQHVYQEHLLFYILLALTLFVIYKRIPQLKPKYKGWTLLAMLSGLSVGGFVLLLWIFKVNNISDLITCIAAFILVVINLTAVFFLPCPSVEKQKLRSEIKGFQMFLAASEKDNLKFKNAPEKTPELLNQYFPYAYALDVEKEWADRFFSILAHQSATNEPTSPESTIIDFAKQLPTKKS